MLSYTEYLSHRLMKKLRNLHGETYTVFDDSNFKQDFGFFSISMQTSKEKFPQNLKIVKEMIHSEVEEGKISDEEINEAKRLYLNNFQAWSQNASGYSRMSERMLAMNEISGLWETPHEILANVTPQQYRLMLKKFGQKNHRYEQINHPEILFQNDFMVFSGLFAIAMFFFFRSILQKPFKNDHVRWVRKVRFLPLKIVEIGVGALIVLACFHSGWAVHKFTDSNLFSKLGVLSFYLEVPIWIFTIIATAQAVISYFPRKLYVMDDYIIMKSLSYFSRRFHKDEIHSIRAISIFKVITSPRMWLPLWNSFHYYDVMFWKKGLMIELKSGKLFYFSTKDSLACVNELKALFTKEKQLATEEKEAA